jgi:hypothetical protein
MLTPTNIWLIALYIGQPIIHNLHGQYTLDGVYSGGIFAKRNPTGLPEDEECEMFPFSEVMLKLKPTPDSLLNRYSDNLQFIKYKVDEGCWIGNQGEFGKSIIKVVP